MESPKCVKKKGHTEPKKLELTTMGQKAPKHKRPNQSLPGQTDKIGQKTYRNRPNMVKIDRNGQRQAKSGQRWPK
jgi:hypothetical protein